MKISEHVPTVPGKILVGTIAAGFTVSGVSFVMILGEMYAKINFKDQTKCNFIQYPLPPLDKHTQFPYNILKEMFIMNSFSSKYLNSSFQY